MIEFEIDGMSLFVQDVVKVIVQTIAKNVIGVTSEVKQPTPTKKVFNNQRFVNCMSIKSFTSEF